MITFQPTGGIPRRKPVTPEGGSIRFSHAAAGLALTLVVTAFCLRAPFTCVGPLADVIQTDLGVSSGTMGSVTTIPLLMFAAFSVVMGDLGRRYRAGYVMVLGLSMVLVGVICRSLMGTYGLFLGTAVVGIGITAGNVLIPAFIKAHFPGRIGRLTGIYTAMMSLMSAVAGAVSVPLGDALGWQGSLMVWGVLIAVVLAMWVPHRDCSLDEDVPEAGGRRALLSSPTTWFIALYLGLQSLIYYAIVAWMAVILQSKGLDPSEAGVVVSVYMIVGIAGSLLLPVAAGGRSDLRALGAGLGLTYIAGLVLLLVSSGSPVSLSLPPADPALRTVRGRLHNLPLHALRPQDQDVRRLVQRLRDSAVCGIPRRGRRPGRRGCHARRDIRLGPGDRVPDLHRGLAGSPGLPHRKGRDHRRPDGISQRIRSRCLLNRILG